MKTAAILLAAGRSTRMGLPKALLTSGGASLYEEACLAIDAVAPIERVLVTNASLLPQLYPRWGGTVLLNDDPSTAPFDSLRLSLRYLTSATAGDPAGAFVLLVDNPGHLVVRLGRLAAAAEREPQKLLAAAESGRAGHPLWLPKDHWSAVLEWCGQEGLRGWFAAAGLAPVPVECGVPGALTDVDSPADWDQFRQRTEQQ